MDILHGIPIWIVFLLTAGYCVLLFEIGFRFGNRIHRRNPEAEVGGATGGVTGGLLGLLAFILAITIGIAGSRHQTRMQLVASEANAIGTAYLRTDFLEEPGRTALQDLLREYTDLRLSISREEVTFEGVATRSEELHNQMWSITMINANEHPEWETSALLVDSINEVIDVHGMRIFYAKAQIPPLLWLVFYMTAGLSFFIVGILNSAVGRRNLIPVILFALVVASVLALIMDLDQAQQGILNVIQGPLMELQRQIGAPGS
jgi:cell division protein FtsL